MIDIGTILGGIRPAYIDPGTGSMVIQVVIAGFLAGLFIFKSYLRRLKAFIANLWKKK